MNAVNCAIIFPRRFWFLGEEGVPGEFISLQSCLFPAYPRLPVGLPRFTEKPVATASCSSTAEEPTATRTPCTTLPAAGFLF